MEIMFRFGFLDNAHLAIRTSYMTLGGSSSHGGRWLVDMLKLKGSEVVAKGL
jgi:hypothetical protein